MKKICVIFLIIIGIVAAWPGYLSLSNRYSGGSGHGGNSGGGYRISSGSRYGSSGYSSYFAPVSRYSTVNVVRTYSGGSGSYDYGSGW